MLPDIGLAEGACTLWQEKLLLDYTIEVEDEQFRVHKVVMASVSDYFKAMLTGGMVESQTDVVRLEGLSSAAVQNIIEFVYTGNLGSLRASPDNLLECAVYLQIPSAIKVCVASLCEEVDKKNCFRILSLFKAYTIKDGIEHTVKFMKQNIEAILRDCDSEELTYEEFLNLMEFWERSEWELFTLARQWLNAGSEEREKHLNDIMSHVRFCLMSPAEVASINDLDLFLDHDGPWQDLVEKALIYHKLPTHQKVLDQSEQSKVRREPAPVCLRMKPPFRGQLFAMDTAKSWIYHKSVNPAPLNLYSNCDPFMTFSEANNFLIVADPDGKYETKWYVYDPRNMTWSTIASTQVPRDGLALCYHDKHLYALGGEDRRERPRSDAVDAIEKYDFQTNNWSIINSKMPSRRTEHSASSIGNCIYITNGYDTHDGGYSLNRSLHCFDSHTGQWSEKNMQPDEVWRNNSNNIVTVEMDGEKVLAGFDDYMKLHYYKPSIDQWLVYHPSAPHKLDWGSFGRMIARGNTVFLLDFERDVEGEEAITPGACEKWTFGEKELQIELLDDYCIVPEESNDPSDNICVLLSHPIHG